MANHPFELKTDKKLMIVRLRLWSTWRMDEADAYVLAFRQAVDEMSATRKPWRILADCTEFPPQSPDVQSLILATMTMAQRGGLKRAANLVNSALSQLQVKRLNQSADINHAFFVDEASALKWLMEG